MSRNVFISILGTNCYQKCNYFYKDATNIIHDVHFVQEASIQLFDIQWKKQDVIFILLTNSARELNWDDGGQLSNSKCQSPYFEGLRTRLSNLNLEASISGISICDGNNEEEIWDQFSIIYELLHENDNLFFDITHSFRSIPMLLMVLLNYAKFLKKINVKAITYGNFEGRNKVSNNSEIIDLTSFSLLQDWTSGANDFITFGNVKKIASLSLKEIEPLLIIAKGDDKNLTSLRKLSKLLPKFVAKIQSNRGVLIIENKDGKQIVDYLDQIKEISIKPLIPLLEVISKKMHHFRSVDDINNGIQAVNWCIEHGLTQQGITILKETITTLVCNEMELNYRIELHRNIVDKCFYVMHKKIEKKEWDPYLLENSVLANSILQKSLLIPMLIDEFNTISQIRNDINHAGFKSNFIRDPEVFNKKLEEILKSVCLKISIYAH